MYKYLPIIPNSNEMLVMLKSLPAYTLVFDKRSNLVDLNKSALQLLKINNVEEFNERKSNVFPVPDYIKIIIYELKKGKIVRHEKTQLKYADNSQVAVELCACMINGCQDLFLFQLFEISLSSNSGLLLSNSYITSCNSDFGASLGDNGVDDSQCIRTFPKENRQIECPATISLMADRQMKLRKPKYRKLSEIETIVSKLVVLNMSVLQIATATNKKDVNVRSIIRRVVEKQRINSMEGLSDEL